MGKYIKKLISIGSQPTDMSFPNEKVLSNLLGEIGEQLFLLLEQKNGFFAFESSLQVFSFGDLFGLVAWNDSSLWRNGYHGLADNIFCFAQDIFGGQFCITSDGNISYFDPETGELDFIAKTIEEWAKDILTNYNFRTGYPLAHEWQSKFGKLQVGHRLIPKIPFVCGGDFKIENLVDIDAVRGMRSRANLACQIKNISDDTEIVFRIID